MSRNFTKVRLAEDKGIKRSIIREKIKTFMLFVLALPIALYGVTGTAEAYTTQFVLASSKEVDKQKSVSTTGRYVAFVTSEPNLVSGDTNSRSDAFVIDTESGVISLVSATPLGSPGNDRTDASIIITGNGRYVLFNSYATNLASISGSASVKNLYLRDMYTSTTYLIEKGTYGTKSMHPIGLSEDARFIYYDAIGSNSPGAYVMDRVLNTTERIDKNTSGTVADQAHANVDNFTQKQVSCDGRFLVIESSATNLVSSDTNGFADIFIIDRMGGHFVKNITLGGNGDSQTPKITCDGNYVIFPSDASNLVSSDANNTRDLFRYNVSNGVIDRVSIKNDESEYSGTSSSGGAYSGDEFDMSMDGRFVFYIRKQTSPQPVLNYLTMRDTELGTTSDIATSSSTYFPYKPASNYDGSKVFYVANNNTGGTYGKLYVVTNHLP